jgi:hypothetical protein
MPAVEAEAETLLVEQAELAEAEMAARIQELQGLQTLVEAVEE